MRWHRRRNIPPELRAVARVVADANIHQFPDLAPVPGRTGPPVSALRSITAELNDEKPLDTQEFRLFRAAYEECRQHLHRVTNGVIASGTPIADVLMLAIRMDTLSTDLGVSLLSLFPVLGRVHAFLLDLSDRPGLGDSELQRQSLLLDRLTQFLYRIVERGEQVLHDYEEWEAQRSTLGSDHGAFDTESSTASSRTPADPPRKVSGSFRSEANCLTTAPIRHGEVALCRSSSGELFPQEFPPAAAFWRPESRLATTNRAAARKASDPVPLSGEHRLPAHLTDAVVSVNADLAVHFAHFQWYVEVTGEGSKCFDAHMYLEDHVLQSAWDFHVGRSHAACTAEEFRPFLPLFPMWSHEAVMSVVNFKDCGVISLHSLQRLLRVWGPLKFLDRNLHRELERGALVLSEPFDYLAFSLAARPDAMVGDYVVGLSDVVGELRIAVLRRARRHRLHLWASTDALPSSIPERAQGGDAPTIVMASPGNEAANLHHRLATVSYTLSCATGAWMVKGLAREEFESAVDAYAAFPEVFKRPCGLLMCSIGDAPLRPTLPSASPPQSLSDGEENTAAPPPLQPVTPTNPGEVGEGTTSALHRACYRNNARYVRTLLDRGGGTVVNTALVDPLVCDSFCWTPLLCAVNNPHNDPAELVAQLLEAGAEVDYMDDAECTALYYAIANGYAETTRLLLEHSPTLPTSPYTVPLLMAIGAHGCHLRGCDVQRLMEVVPAAAVVRVVVAHEHSLALVALATTILEEKLSGRDHRVSSSDRHLVAQHCSAGSAGAERYTSTEAEQLKRWVHHHTHRCLEARQDVQEAVRVLYARQYALSWRVWLDSLDASSKGGAAPWRRSQGAEVLLESHSPAPPSRTAGFSSLYRRTAFAVTNLPQLDHNCVPDSDKDICPLSAQQLATIRAIEYVI
ncbi:hypothetical protein JKF63_00620 [Porcisia hertigi]|uniref:Uncharacterized protein n=1 Tax=Porcisia hertigi TaxID=2761500 RepID=A0A836HTV7_9TRYP|nr:hypothetical protein JKF63_00620 [Porcisia hertigi]